MATEKLEALVKKLSEKNIHALMESYKNSGYSYQFTDWLVKKSNEDCIILHWLLETGYEDIFCILVDRGAKINKKTKYLDHTYETTLLHIAARKNRYTAAEKIIAIDPSQINSVDSSKRSPIKYSKNDKMKEILSFLTTDESSDDSSDFNSTSSSNYSIKEGHTPIKAPLNTNSPTWKDVACAPDDYQWLIKPTGQLQWKSFDNVRTIKQNVSNERWGSGFMISDTLFMTAGHCFDAQSSKNGWYVLDGETQNPLSPSELVPFLKVNFNYQADNCPIPISTNKNYTSKSTSNSSAISMQYNMQTEFNIVRLVEHRESGLDYAILELDGLPGMTYNRVSLCADEPNIHDEVIVVQHPDGLEKKFAMGPVCQETGSKISYQLDTNGGSSGSPVGMDNKLKAVVAVHTNGFSETDEKKCNSGVTIAAIKEASRILNNSSHYGILFKNIEQEDSHVNDKNRSTSYHNKGFY